MLGEFARYKGHRYASEVLDADTRRVLWIGESYSREAIRPLTETQRPPGFALIEATAMSMNTAADL